MQKRKQLPSGTWFIFDVAQQTTEDQIAENFSRVGIHLTYDRVSIEDGQKGTHAVISVPGEIIRALLQARLSTISVNGKQIDLHRMPQPQGSRGERKRLP